MLFSTSRYFCPELCSIKLNLSHLQGTEDLELVSHSRKYSFVETMKANPDQHRPVFTTLSDDPPIDSPRRMAFLSDLRPSKFVTMANLMKDNMISKFAELGYRAIQPSVLFNLGEAPAQEPHMDGEVVSEKFPTLSILANPLTLVQGVWVARNSHRLGVVYLEKIRLAPGHAIALRHDTCHAGFATPKGTINVRIHMNLVHESDTRTNFTFDEWVIPCIRGRFGSRFRMPADDFGHVLHHVNHEDDNDGQARESEQTDEEPKHKRKATEILGAIVKSGHQKIRVLESRANNVSSQILEDRERVANARQILQEHEATLRQREQALQTIRNEIVEEQDAVNASEYAIARL